MNGIELDALGCGAFRTPVGTKGIPGVWDIEPVTSTCIRFKNGEREWFANRASCASLTSFCVIRCYGLLRSATITKFGVPQLLVQNRMWSQMLCNNPNASKLGLPVELVEVLRMKLGSGDYYIGFAPSRQFWNAKSTAKVRETGKVDDANSQALVFGEDRYEDTVCGSDRYHGSHNLCMCRSLNDKGDILAVGGMNGVALYKLDWPNKKWSAQMELVGVHHPGGIERRPGATSLIFDGQSCTQFQGEWFLYSRANIGAAGYRYVQVCKGTSLDSLGPFQLVHVAGYDVSNDMYMLHAYDLGSVMLAICPVSFGKDGGIYACTSTDGIHFRPLRMLLPCACQLGRTAHMPAYGINVHAHRLRFYVHENVPSRVKTKESERVCAYEVNVNALLEC